MHTDVNGVFVESFGRIHCVQRVYGGIGKMCELCWESYYAGYIRKGEIWQCIYYLDLMRSKWDTQRRIPKREPDDPRYTVDLGEGLLPFMFSDLRDQKDWFSLMYLPTRRRKLHRLKIAGKGADAPEERAARGVEDETIWVAETTLHDF